MSDPAEIVSAAIIIIGNEILSGRTPDKNLPYLAERLNELGIQVREARIIADVAEEIGDAVNECRAKYDYVFTTGGIGPTHDDITADSMAAAFGVGIDYHPEAKALLERHYATTGGDLNEARMRMARIPDGGILVDNPVSKAPGFQLENVFVLAGVPAIAREMFESLKHRLVGGAPVQSIAIAAHLSEGAIAAPLGDLQQRYADVDLGSYPFYRNGRYGTSIVCRSPNVARLEAAAEELRGIMRGLGGEPIEDVVDPA